MFTARSTLTTQHIFALPLRTAQ